MKDQIAPIQIHYVLHYMTLVMLILSANVTGESRKSNCHNRFDIAFAVDTTSSESPSSFDQVKSELKSIVAGFTVGQDKVRLALISMSKDTNVIVNFNRVNSISDFNTAVDTLKFSTDVVDVSGGMKLAKDSVLSTARSDVSRILILVKDRRSRFADVSSAPVLSGMTREAAEVKALGCAINVVGIGGLWNRLEIEAVFGSDYNLFKNKNAALSFVKSLNNKHCTIADCTKSSENFGLCYGSRKYGVMTTVDSMKRSYGMVKCEKRIVRRFDKCSISERCMQSHRIIGPCIGGEVKIFDMWQIFDHKSQRCADWSETQSVKCEDADKCKGQVADIIFILDKSGSIGSRFYLLKDATNTIIESLTIGSKNVRVGVLCFGSAAYFVIPLGSINKKRDLIRLVNLISNRLFVHTNTHEALRVAGKALTGKYGRKSVDKFVILITDGKSSNPDETFKQTAALKNAGITLYAIGVGSVKLSELVTMTAPETKTNLFLMNNPHDLHDWARAFSIQSCIRLSAPNPKLCEIKVYARSISDCTYGKQIITETKYQYDAVKKCIKIIQTEVQRGCKRRCVDPINGNDVMEGHRWENLCHKFYCSNKGLITQTTKCIAADGSCKAPGSPAFDCKDEHGVVKTNCRCVKSDTNVALVIGSD